MGAYIEIDIADIKPTVLKIDIELANKLIIDLLQGKSQELQEPALVIPSLTNDHFIALDGHELLLISHAMNLPGHVYFCTSKEDLIPDTEPQAATRNSLLQARFDWARQVEEQMMDFDQLLDRFGLYLKFPTLEPGQSPPQ